MSQAQFRRSGPSLIDRARHWVGRQLTAALDRALSGHLGVLGAIVLVVLIGLVVVAVVRTVRGSRHTGPVPGRAGRTAHRSPAEWLAEAAACEVRGDWRGALRARYLALVAELAGRGVVAELPGRTAGEYRAEVAGHLPAAAPEFAGATDLFEAAVYGGAPAGPAEAAQLAALSERVVAGAR